MMSMEDDLVRSDRFQPGYLGPFGPDEFQKLLKHGIGVLSEIGVLGDPSKADAGHGKVYLDALIRHMADTVSHLLE